MSEKDQILGRIREALTVPAIRPGRVHGVAGTTGPSNKVSAGPKRWLPKTGTSNEENLALFQKNCADLKATVVLLNDERELGGAIAKLAAVENWKQVATHSIPLTDSACTMLSVPVVRVDQGYKASALEQSDAGISGCDALVAQTGSVLLSSRSAGGRALSVLPPHHVVIARREQIVADLPDAFALVRQRYASDYPSFISFVTGPSRTGDIERILVLGAHGPKKLTIFCC